MSLRENLTTDTVSELQSSQVVCVAPEQPIADAVALMRREKTGAVLICDENRLVGIFTERDVMRIIARGGDLTAPVASVMSSEPATISPNASVGQAVMQMHEGGYRRLPVVDGQGAPTAIVRLKSVVHYLAEHFPSSVYNQPPVSRPVTKDREGA